MYYQKSDWPKDLSYETLSIWSQKNGAPSSATPQIHIAKIIAHSDPDLITRNLGVEALLWAYFLMWMFPHEESILETSLVSQGFDNFDLERYRRDTLNLERFNGYPAKAENFIAAIHLENQLKGLNDTTISLVNLIKKHAINPDKGVSDPENFTVRFVSDVVINSKFHSHGDMAIVNLLNDKELFKPYQDSQLSIILYYKGRPTAIVSFAVIGPNHILVTQIQGIKKGWLGKGNGGIEVDLEGNQIRIKSGRGLAKVKWMPLLVDIVEQAIGEKFSISIQSVDNNYWTRLFQEETEPHVELANAKKIYDRVAQDRNMVRDLTTNNWINKNIVAGSMMPGILRTERNSRVKDAVLKLFHYCKDVLK